MGPGCAGGEFSLGRIERCCSVQPVSELAPQPLNVLARRIWRELDRHQAIFDLPARHFVLGSARHDLSVAVAGHRAAAPFGPAAGPHTQLAPNIVLAWLIGGRVIELKTVQANDRLTLPRPCIDMQTVGYNVEWSQELTLEQSLDEYVKASMLIRLLAAGGRLELAPGFDRTVFDMSLGYDLAGVRSERVQAFVRGMLDASVVLERLRRELPDELGPLRDLDFRPRVSDTVTLSTFHGCPPAEIEAIARHLMETYRLSCVVKLNPTLLGAATLRALLHDQFGYNDLHVPDFAFDNDLAWESAIELLDRLQRRAAELGLHFGVKFCNTLVVENHRRYFPQSERVMYLSGPPLHTLAMHLVRRLRSDCGNRYSLSFSAGIDRGNFPDAVALGLAPVTVCTDLLREGGYGRGAGYLEALMRRMDEVGATTIDEFVVRACGDGGPSERDAAQLRNTGLYVDQLADEPRLHARTQRALPYKMGRRLELFDCSSCNKCVPICPNDAMFSVEVASAPRLALNEPRQYVSFADACNDCGNCEVFCPEDGGPNRVKPRLFVDRARWLADAPRDSILVEPEAITGRFNGEEVRLEAWSVLDADPRKQTLLSLREALLAPGVVNPVSARLIESAAG